MKKNTFLLLLIMLSHFAFSQIYVNQNATGNNDGTSWNDAYIDLQDAVTNATAGNQIWIAQGIYKPHASNKNSSFVIAANNVQVYGGFNATEITLADRDLNANYNTILSGDLNGDDTGVDFTANNRSDNSYRVVNFDANMITFDGIQINDGNAIGNTSSTDYAAGVNINSATKRATFKNCEFNNNVAKRKGGALQYHPTSIGTSNIFIENCIFNNNLSSYGAGFYISNVDNVTPYLHINNSLFTNNVTKDFNASNKGISGSALFLNSIGQGWIMAYIGNCTFANNTDIGTETGEHGPLAFTRIATTSHQRVDFTNNIIYGNTTTGGTTALGINSGNSLIAEVKNIFNSIDEDNFSNINTSDLTATSNANPLFIDSTNNDFTLQSTSPAIDTGVNDQVHPNTTTDLIGNARINNNTVDMGCYEYYLAIYTLITSASGNGVVAPNGTTSHNDGDIISLYPIPITSSWVFSHWTGDASGNANPLSVTMNADKSIEAVFTQIQRTLTTTVSGNGTISPNGTNTYNDGDTVTITATPNTGYVFDHWTGSANGNTNPLSVIMNTDKSIEAVFQSTASINNMEFVNLNIYPNPAKNILHIDLDKEIKTIEIYNVLGAKMIESNETKINVSNLSVGTYFIKITTKDSQSITKHFMKK